jgi:hypothetical protein
MNGEQILNKKSVTLLKVIKTVPVFELLARTWPDVGGGATAAHSFSGVNYQASRVLIIAANSLGRGESWLK